jgi:hypothetical protein
MPTPVNSTKGAELIEAAVAPRRCSRQNLEKLCDRGALQGSPCILQAKPLRVDADLLVAEYLARVGQNQSEAQQPTVKRQASTAPAAKALPPPAAPPPRHAAADPPPPPPGEVPNFNDERALHEREKRLIAEMDRMEKAKLLLPRQEVDLAWGNAVNITRTRLLGVPSAAKQRIPHLEIEEVELLTTLIREALDELAAGEVKA